MPIMHEGLYVAQTTSQTTATSTTPALWLPTTTAVTLSTATVPCNIMVCQLYVFGVQARVRGCQQQARHQARYVCALQRINHITSTCLLADMSGRVGVHPTAQN